MLIGAMRIGGVRAAIWLGMRMGKLGARLMWDEGMIEGMMREGGGVIGVLLF